MKIKKPVKLIIIILLSLAVIGTAALFMINVYVKSAVRQRILSSDAAAKLRDVDCIIVLGCQVKGDGSLSPMLRDRLITAVKLYNEGAAPKLLMSGDHGQKEYNEVGAMKKYATENGVLSADVFMDHAGFSTYETVYRAKEIFKAKKVIIVTQQYHLYRALYIAKRLGLDAYGVSCDLNAYAGQSARDLREIFARDKDFFKCIFKPEPTYLGDPIPISGNGDLTDDYGYKKAEESMKEIKISRVSFSPGYGDMLGAYHGCELRKEKDGRWICVCRDREAHCEPTVVTVYCVSDEAVARFEEFIKENGIFALENRPESDLFMTDYSPWSWNIDYDTVFSGKTERRYFSLGEYRRYSGRDYELLRELERRFLALRGEKISETREDKQ